MSTSGLDSVVDLTNDLNIRVSHANESQTHINSEDGYDLTPSSFLNQETVNGDELDIENVKDSAQISYTYTDALTAEVNLDSDWNSVKNIEIQSDTAASITVNNFVHADVSLGDGGSSSVIINDAKRGFVETGDGSDYIQINAHTNGSGWSNTIHVSSNEGNDTIIVNGDENITEIVIDAGLNDDVVTLGGAYKNSQVNLGDGTDVFTGNDAFDSISVGAGVNTLTTGLGSDTITITDVNSHNIINDFGGVGGGGKGESNLMPYYDTIILSDPSMTAENMIIHYDGTDTSITFEGLTSFSLTLKSFDFTDLDNLKHNSTYNIIFGDEVSGSDSYDVFNDHGAGQNYIWNKNSVTFLNNANNTVNGKNNSDDVINGMAGDDVLDGLSGNDILRGQEGNDTLINRDGDSILDGGSGDDTFIIDINALSYIKDVSGIDLIKIENADISKITIGDDGQSLLYDGLVFVTFDDITAIENIQFEDSDIQDFESFLSLLTTDGEDVVDASQSSRGVVVDGLEGDDTIAGSDFEDKIQGSVGKDTIFGGDGDDFLAGGHGADLIYAGLGNDTVRGNQWHDEIYGEQGFDNLLGNIGDDLIYGGLDADRLDGGEDDDILYGGEGDENTVTLSDGSVFYGGLFGGEGNDTLYGEQGNDRLDGGIGDDLLDGGIGDDYLDGKADNDTLIGDAGNDTLIGGEGNDTLIGGTGQDLLNGGAGSDTYSFSADEDSVDRIKSFDLSEDMLDITNILTGFDGSDLSNFVEISHVGERFDLRVDRDGGGDNFETIARVFTNIDDSTTAQDLYDSGVLIADQSII